MWTEEDRRKYRREGAGYPSDLRDAEWARLKPLIPPAPARRATTQDRYASGDGRHPVPASDRLPLALSAAGQLSAALDVAHGFARTDGPTGGEPVGGSTRQPIGQIGGKRGGNDGKVGYDAGKRVKGRKIHALVDSEGLPMRVVVHSAEIQDRDGAGLVLDKIRRRFPWLELIWADGGYNAWQVYAAVAKVPPLRTEKSSGATT